MAPRFDSTHRTLRLAVADLLDTQLLRSLGFANRGGYERMWLGQAIHSRYQEAALEHDPTYRHEIRLEHTFEHRGWTVTVHGRADGLRRDPDGVLVVEEIKSIRRGAQLAPLTKDLYERQAALYVWMLEESRRHLEAVEPIRAELVLIEIGGDGAERLPVEIDPRALRASIFRRLNAIVRTFESEEAKRGARRAAAETLRFPYDEKRPGQETIITAVERALEAGDHLLLQAPTGIGKTVATLDPVLRHALAKDRRVFVLTAKTLQQDMAMKVLDLLNQDAAWSALRLRAKAKMCANDQVLCHEEYCTYAREYFLKMQRTGLTGELLDNHPHLEPELIYAHARRAEVCPFEVSLDLAGRVQVAVCDYNYAFDPYVALTDFAAEADLSQTVLVIDEIHNLLDRGRGYYSPQLSSIAARRAGDTVAFGGAPIHRELAGLCYHLASLIEDTVADLQPPGDPQRWALEEALPETELWRLRPRLDAAFIEYLEYRRETKTLTADDLFVELYFGVLKFLNALVLSDHVFSHLIERDGDDRRLRILCKDPSRFLGGVISRCHSVIGLSATLRPPELYRDLLGFETHRTVMTDVPSPFPAANRRVVIDAGVSTLWRERPAQAPVIAERLADLADAVPGNCLALFPSYAFLSDVGGLLRTRSKRVLVQTRSDGDRQRNEILETLRGAMFGDVLLLAVAGGVFAEGVDYPGEMLKAVAVIGPCLPAVTLEQELLKAYYDERFERGFEYAFVVPGMTRVVQAAGRLIRSAEDTGVIALFDRRFLSRPYREHLPAEWLGDGRLADLRGDPGEVARRFFTEGATDSKLGSERG